MEALRRHRLRRRLPAAPAAGQGTGLLGPQDHRPHGPPGRDLQPHAGRLSRPAPLRRHALPAHGLRRGHDRPAVGLCPRRAGPPLGSHRTYPQVRVLGFPRPGDRRDGPLPRLRGPGPGDDGDPRLPGRRPGDRQRRLRGDLRPLDELRGLQRRRREPRLPGRRPATATPSSSRSTPRPSPGPTSCA